MAEHLGLDFIVTRTNLKECLTAHTFVVHYANDAITVLPDAEFMQVLRVQQGV